MEDKTELKRLGAYVRGLRKQRGLTQADLARLCGVSASTITKCEAGETAISFETAKKISIALRVTINDLLRADGILSDEDITGYDNLAAQLFLVADYNLIQPEQYDKGAKIDFGIVGHGKEITLTKEAYYDIVGSTIRYFKFQLDNYIKYWEDVKNGL